MRSAHANEISASTTVSLADLKIKSETTVAGACALVLLALVLFASVAHADGPAPSDQWTFSLKPYLWVPGVTGTLKYDIPPGSGGGPTVDLGSWVVENLSLALMISGEARKGDWSVITDVVYLDVNSQNSSVKSVDFAFGPGGRIPVAVGANIDTKSGLRGELWELAGGYTMARSDHSSIDVLTGFRYLSIRAFTDWQLTGDITGPGPGQSFARSGGISQSAVLWNWIIGIRGAVGLGRSWAVPYYFDVGTGSSSVTWQALSGIEYRFAWGDVQLSYRYLYYNMQSNGLLQGVSFSGPGLGVNFHF